MAKYSFPGSPAFIEAAAQQAGHPEAAGSARQIATLAALANLCAQAGDAAPEHVPSILARAVEFRRQIHVALLAADLMLAEVSAARCVPGADLGEKAMRDESRGPSKNRKPRPEPAEACPVEGMSECSDPDMTLDHDSEPSS